MLVRLFLPDFIVLDAVVDHVKTEYQQQRERNPMIPAFNKLGSHLANAPADDRGDGLDYTKDQAGTQRFNKARFMKTGALAESRCKGVCGHCKREKEEGNRVHG